MNLSSSLRASILCLGALSGCAPASYEGKLVDQGVTKIREYCDTSAAKFDTNPRQTGDTEKYRLVICLNSHSAVCKDKFNDVMGRVAEALNKSSGADVEGSSIGKYYVEVVYPNICLVVL